jgi:hypothetical protein
MKFERWQCQMCGAPIGIIGRWFQKILGCFLVQSRECRRRG